MKFQITHNRLNNSLKNMIPFIDRGHQLDILKNILLKTKENALEISATNLSVSIIETVHGSCKKQGAITVKASLFRDYIQNLDLKDVSPKQAKSSSPLKVDLEVDGNKLLINCRDNKAVINGLPVKDYPKFPVSKKDKPILTIKTDDLRTAISQTVFATSKDITRTAITGVFLHLFENGLYVAATDTYRLAEKKIKASVKNIEDPQLIIPSSTLLGLERILANYPKQSLTLYKEEHTKADKHILFILEEEEIEINSALTVGTYPQYRKLLPETFATKIVVNKQSLMNAAKRIHLFAQENSIILSWQKEGLGSLHVKSIDSQVGGAEESVDAKITVTKADSDTTIHLNVKYLQEALQAIESKDVEIGLNSKLDPCVLFSCGSKSKPSDYRHAIMPMRN